MLGLFRKKIFVNNIFLLIYTILLFCPILFWDDIRPEFVSEGILSEHMYFLNGSEIKIYILTVLMVFFQAVMINDFTSKHRLDEVNSMFPGMTYVLFLAIFENGTILNPALTANIFVILSLSNILDFYKEKGIPTKTYNAGFFISVASLLNAAYTPLLIFPMMALFGFRKTDFQELLQIITGLISPFLMVWCLFFILDVDFHMFDDWVAGYWNPGLELPYTNLVEMLQIGFYSFCLAIVILMQNSFLTGMNIHAKNKNGGLYYYFVFAVAGLILFSGIDSDNLLILTPVLAFFFSVIFIRLRPAFGELIHLALLGLLTYIQFFL